jgi:chromosome segregation ATPase
MKEYKVTAEQVSLFLETIKKSSVQAQCQPNEVIQACIKLTDLENQSGKPYPQALKEYQTMTQQTPKIKQGISKLKLALRRARRSYKKAFEEAKTTPQALSEFHDCKAALRRDGLDIEDSKTDRKILDNYKEAGGDAKHLVSLVKKHDSIPKLVAHLDEQLLTKQNELTNLLSQTREHQQIISQLREEQKQLEFTSNSQKNAINSNNYQLNLLQANIAELEKRREALITWIGKQLDLPQEEIENLRLNSQCDTLLVAIDNALRDALRSRYGA